MTYAISEDYYSSDESNDSAYEYSSYERLEDTLRFDIERHLSTIEKYRDEKHIQKANVLKVAIDVLKGLVSQEALQEAIAQNPNYNKAIFESETEVLVRRTINLAPQLSDNELELSQKIQKELAQARNQPSSSSSSSSSSTNKPYSVQLLEMARDVLKGKEYPSHLIYLQQKAETRKVDAQDNSLENAKNLTDETLNILKLNKKPRDDQNNQARQRLRLEIQNQLNSFSGKTGEKYEDKKAVLQKALEVLQNKATTNDLRQEIKNHPKYNEALFTSKTEQLLIEVVNLTNKSSYRP